MATTKDVERTPSGRLKYRGETFSGYNKPKRTPDGPKKFAVLAKKDDQVKLVRFGDPNMEIKKDSPERRKSFRARHKCDTAKDKFSARYWSCKSGKIMSLVKNINKRKKNGTSRSKKNSTVSDKAYKDMQQGWRKSKGSKKAKK